MRLCVRIFFFIAIFSFFINPSYSYAAVGDYIDRWSTSSIIYTLTWDGSYLWISDTNSPVKFKKYTADGATTSDSFNLTAENGAPSGIAWDGDSFWVLDSVDKEVYEYDSDGNYQSNSWSLNASAGGGATAGTRGLTWDGTNFWVVWRGTDRMYQYNASGTYTGTSIDLSASGNNDAIDATWNGSYFWVTDYIDLEVYQYNASGTYQGNWSATSTNTGMRGIDSNDSYFFVADSGSNYIYRYSATTTPPTITSVSSDKANGTYGTGEVIDIDITFSKAVTATSSITVTLETGDTDRTCTFTVSNAGTSTCNYIVQSGDVSGDLMVSSISGYIEDQLGNAMVNFTPTTNLSVNKALVIDGVAPTVSIFSPADDTSDVAIDSSLTVTFDQVVDAVSGYITLKRESDDVVFETFDVTSNISGSGSTEITINPSLNLINGTEYYVQIDATAFDDVNSNSYVGILDSVTWTFTTVAVGETPTSVSSGGGISVYKRIENRIEDGATQKANDLIKKELNNELEDNNPSLSKLKRLLQLLIKSNQGLLEGGGSVTSDENGMEGEDVPGQTSGHSFLNMRDMYLDDQGDDVRELQLFLIEQDAGPSSRELARVGATGYFGNYTKNALGELQLEEGIVPYVGYFGHITRSYLSGGY